MNTKKLNHPLTEINDDELKEIGAAFLTIAKAIASCTPTPVTTAAAPSADTSAMKKNDLARELKVSPATITRLKITPSHFVGNSPRFDLVAVKAELAARGRKSTQAKKQDEDPIDVSSAARSAGLRAIGGGR